MQNPQYFYIKSIEKKKKKTLSPLGTRATATYGQFLRMKKAPRLLVNINKKNSETVLQSLFFYIDGTYLQSLFFLSPKNKQISLPQTNLFWSANIGPNFSRPCELLSDQTQSLKTKKTFVPVLSRWLLPFLGLTSLTLSRPMLQCSNSAKFLYTTSFSPVPLKIDTNSPENAHEYIQSFAIAKTKANLQALLLSQKRQDAKVKNKPKNIYFTAASLLDFNTQNYKQNNKSRHFFLPNSFCPNEDSFAFAQVKGGKETQGTVNKQIFEEVHVALPPSLLLKQKELNLAYKNLNKKHSTKQNFFSRLEKILVTQTLDTATVATALPIGEVAVAKVWKGPEGNEVSKKVQLYDAMHHEWMECSNTPMLQNNESPLGSPKVTEEVTERQKTARVAAGHKKTQKDIFKMYGIQKLEAYKIKKTLLTLFKIKNSLTKNPSALSVLTTADLSLESTDPVVLYTPIKNTLKIESDIPFKTNEETAVLLNDSLNKNLSATKLTVSPKVTSILQKAQKYNVNRAGTFTFALSKFSPIDALTNFRCRFCPRPLKLTLQQNSQSIKKAPFLPQLLLPKRQQRSQGSFPVATLAVTQELGYCENNSGKSLNLTKKLVKTNLTPVSKASQKLLRAYLSLKKNQINHHDVRADYKTISVGRARAKINVSSLLLETKSLMTKEIAAVKQTKKLCLPLSSPSQCQKNKNTKVFNLRVSPSEFFKRAHVWSNANSDKLQQDLYVPSLSQKESAFNNSGNRFVKESFISKLKEKQKKRRAKKQRRNTRTRKKRKRFYPRPSLASFKTNLSFLTRRRAMISFNSAQYNVQSYGLFCYPVATLAQQQELGKSDRTLKCLSNSDPFKIAYSNRGEGKRAPNSCVTARVATGNSLLLSSPCPPRGQEQGDGIFHVIPQSLGQKLKLKSRVFEKDNSGVKLVQPLSFAVVNKTVKSSSVLANNSLYKISPSTFKKLKEAASTSNRVRSNLKVYLQSLRHDLLNVRHIVKQMHLILKAQELSLYLFGFDLTKTNSDLIQLPASNLSQQSLYVQSCRFCDSKRSGLFPVATLAVTQELGYSDFCCPFAVAKATGKSDRSNSKLNLQNNFKLLLPQNRQPKQKEKNLYKGYVFAHKDAVFEKLTSLRLKTTGENLFKFNYGLKTKLPTKYRQRYKNHTIDVELKPNPYERNKKARVSVNLTDRLGLSKTFENLKNKGEPFPKYRTMWALRQTNVLSSPFARLQASGAKNNASKDHVFDSFSTTIENRYADSTNLNFPNNEKIRERSKSSKIKKLWKSKENLFFKKDSSKIFPGQQDLNIFAPHFAATLDSSKSKAKTVPEAKVPSASIVSKVKIGEKYGKSKFTEKMQRLTHLSLTKSIFRLKKRTPKHSLNFWWSYRLANFNFFDFGLSEYNVSSDTQTILSPFYYLNESTDAFAQSKVKSIEGKHFVLNSFKLMCTYICIHVGLFLTLLTFPEVRSLLLLQSLLLYKFLKTFGLISTTVADFILSKSSTLLFPGAGVPLGDKATAKGLSESKRQKNLFLSFYGRSTGQKRNLHFLNTLKTYPLTLRSENKSKNFRRYALTQAILKKSANIRAAEDKSKNSASLKFFSLVQKSSLVQKNKLNSVYQSLLLPSRYVLNLKKTLAVLKATGTALFLPTQLSPKRFWFKEGNRRKQRLVGQTDYLIKSQSFLYTKNSTLQAFPVFLKPDSDGTYKDSTMSNSNLSQYSLYAQSPELNLNRLNSSARTEDNINSVGVIKGDNFATAKSTSSKTLKKKASQSIRLSGVKLVTFGDTLSQYIQYSFDYSILIYRQKNLFLSILFKRLFLLTVSLTQNLTKPFYLFLQNPAELTVEWLGETFLIEWSADPIAFVPDSFDLRIFKSFQKISRTLKIFGPSFFLIERYAVRAFFEAYYATLTLPDKDLLTRYSKGFVFWELCFSTEQKRRNAFTRNAFTTKQLKKGSSLRLGKENKNKFKTLDSTKVTTDFITQLTNLNAEKREEFLTDYYTYSLPLTLELEKENLKFSPDSNAPTAVKWNKNLNKTKFLREEKFLLQCLNSQKTPAITITGAIEKMEHSINYCFRNSERPPFLKFFDLYTNWKPQEADLFFELSTPRSFRFLPQMDGSFSNQSAEWSATVGPIVCQLLSGTFALNVSKNVLIIGPPGENSRTFVQALAGETETKLIVDYAQRYALIRRGVPLGMKLLRSVFESIPLHVPSIFLIRDIHVIGERRSSLGFGSDCFTGKSEETEEAHELDIEMYGKIRKTLTLYKKPYKGDFSSLIPSNFFSFEYFLGINPRRTRRKGRTPTHPMGTKIRDISRSSFSAHSDGNQMSSGLNMSLSKTSLRSKLDIYSSTNRPALGNSLSLHIKNDKKLKPKKVVQTLPWLANLASAGTMSKPSYSIRVKVALLSSRTLSNLSAKLDMITDLLVIIDGVRAHRGFAVFATTHVPSILDPALRRPGRFGETVKYPSASKQKLFGRDKGSLADRWSFAQISVHQLHKTFDLFDWTVLLTGIPDAYLHNYSLSIKKAYGFTLASAPEATFGDGAVTSYSSDGTYKYSTGAFAKAKEASPQSYGQTKDLIRAKGEHSHSGNWSISPKLINSLRLNKSLLNQPILNEDKEKRISLISLVDKYNSIAGKKPFEVSSLNKVYLEDARIDLKKKKLNDSMFGVNFAQKKKKDLILTGMAFCSRKNDRYSRACTNLCVQSYRRAGVSLIHAIKTKSSLSFVLKTLEEDKFLSSVMLSPRLFDGTYKYRKGLLTQKGTFRDKKDSVLRFPKVTTRSEVPFAMVNKNGAEAKVKIDYSAIDIKVQGKYKDFSNDSLSNMNHCLLTSLSIAEKSEVFALSDAKLPYVQKKYLAEKPKQGKNKKNCFSYNSLSFGSNHLKLSSSLNESLQYQNNIFVPDRPSVSANDDGMHYVMHHERNAPMHHQISRNLRCRETDSKNLVCTRLLSFNNKVKRREVQSPPVSSALNPTRLFENLKRTEKVFRNQFKENSENFISKAERKQKNSLMRNLSSRLNLSQSTPQKSVAFKNTHLNGSDASSSLSNSEGSVGNNKKARENMANLNVTFLKNISYPTNTLENFRSKFLERQRFYFTNQWWSGQLNEQSTEKTFSSDIDWRYVSIPFRLGEQKRQVPLRYGLLLSQNRQEEERKNKTNESPLLLTEQQKKLTSFAQINSILPTIDFPDSEKYSNPRERRWLRRSGFCTFFDRFGALEHSIYPIAFTMPEADSASFNPSLSVSLCPPRKQERQETFGPLAIVAKNGTDAKVKISKNFNERILQTEVWSQSKKQSVIFQKVKQSRSIQRQKQKDSFLNLNLNREAFDYLTELILRRGSIKEIDLLVFFSKYSI
uniref:Cell division protein n=1 Tax=Johansenicoccus eremophilus TaxID=3068301 RepID=A0AA49QYH8_9CHLO|nr:cell division protein [Chlorophyceae sp. KF-2023a]